MAGIAKLNKVDAECTEMSEVERFRYREQYSRPVLGGILQCREDLKISALPPGPL